MGIFWPLLTFDMSIVFLTSYPSRTFITIAKCRDLIFDDSPTLVVDISNPATVGTTATFSCHSGLSHTLIGPNTTTCIWNGEWEPDPRETKCKGHTNRQSIHVTFIFRPSLLTH